MDSRHRFYVASRQATTLVTVAAAASDAAEPVPSKRPRLGADTAAPPRQVVLEPADDATHEAGPRPPSGAGAAEAPQMPFGLLHVRDLEPSANACAPRRLDSKCHVWS